MKRDRFGCWALFGSLGIMVANLALGPAAAAAESLSPGSRNVYVEVEVKPLDPDLSPQDQVLAKVQAALKSRLKDEFTDNELEKGGLNWLKSGARPDLLLKVMYRQKIPGDQDPESARSTCTLEWTLSDLGNDGAKIDEGYVTLNFEAADCPLGNLAKRTIEILVRTYTASGRREFSAQLRPRVAVLPFTDANREAGVSRLGRSVSAMLLNALERYSQFILVDRVHVVGGFPAPAPSTPPAQRSPESDARETPPEAWDPRWRLSKEQLRDVDAVILGTVTLWTDDTADLDVQLVGSDGHLMASEHALAYLSRGSEEGLRRAVFGLGRRLEEAFLRPYLGDISVTVRGAHEPVHGADISLYPILSVDALPREFDRRQFDKSWLQAGLERRGDHDGPSLDAELAAWTTDREGRWSGKVLRGWYSLRVRRAGYYEMGDDGRDLRAVLQARTTTNGDGLREPGATYQFVPYDGRPQEESKCSPEDKPHQFELPRAKSPTITLRITADALGRDQGEIAGSEGSDPKQPKSCPILVHVDRSAVPSASIVILQPRTVQLRFEGLSPEHRIELRSLDPKVGGERPREETAEGSSPGAAPDSRVCDGRPEAGNVRLCRADCCSTFESAKFPELPAGSYELEVCHPRFVCTRRLEHFDGGRDDSTVVLPLDHRRTELTLRFEPWFPSSIELRGRNEEGAYSSDSETMPIRPRGNLAEIADLVVDDYDISIGCQRTEGLRDDDLDPRSWSQCGSPQPPLRYQELLDARSEPAANDLAPLASQESPCDAAKTGLWATRYRKGSYGGIRSFDDCRPPLPDPAEPSATGGLAAFESALAKVDLIVLDDAEVRRILPNGGAGSADGEHAIASRIRSLVAEGRALLLRISEPGDYSALLPRPLVIEASDRRSGKKELKLRPGKVPSIAERGSVRLGGSLLLPAASRLDGWRVLATAKAGLTGGWKPFALEHRHPSGGYVLVWLVDGNQADVEPRLRDGLGAALERRAFHWARYLMYRRLGGESEPAAEAGRRLTDLYRDELPPRPSASNAP